MKIWTKWILTAFLAVGLASFAVGCGSSDDDDDSSPSDPAGDAPVVEHVDVAGVWAGTRSSGGSSTSIQFSFNQSGGDLQGSYQDTSGFAGNLGGTINGDDIVLTITLTAGSPGDTWAFSGAVNAAGTSLNGTMSTEAGSDTVQATK